MTHIERALVLGALIYMAAYLPCFFVVFFMRATSGQFVSVMVPFHMLGLLLNLVAFLLTLRDLYLREFASKNAKVTWTLLILMTAGVGWIVYIFKHALKPRNQATGSGLIL